jgi:putative transposase
LRRDGFAINPKKTQRLYREEGLTVRRRKGRKRGVGARVPAPIIALHNQRWSLDFVHDQLASGRRFRVLNVVVDVKRECLAAVPDTSICGKRVVRELTDLIAVRGKPGMIVSDNGTGLTSNAVLEWCGTAKIDWHYTAPGRQPRTRSWRALTGKCVMNCLMRRCLLASIMPARRSLRGLGIITPGGLCGRTKKQGLLRSAS